MGRHKATATRRAGLNKGYTLRPFYAGSMAYIYGWNRLNWGNQEEVASFISSNTPL